MLLLCHLLLYLLQEQLNPAAHQRLTLSGLGAQLFEPEILLLAVLLERLGTILLPLLELLLLPGGGGLLLLKPLLGPVQRAVLHPLPTGVWSGAIFYSTRQCCGSVSVGSICFWASRIRIRIH
jgi:hypothetical protein